VALVVAVAVRAAFLAPAEPETGSIFAVIVIGTILNAAIVVNRAAIGNIVLDAYAAPFEACTAARAGEAAPSTVGGIVVLVGLRISARPVATLQKLAAVVATGAAVFVVGHQVDVRHVSSMRLVRGHGAVGDRDVVIQPGCRVEMTDGDLARRFGGTRCQTHRSQGPAKGGPDQSLEDAAPGLA
jgi:hypothetical protein